MQTNSLQAEIARKQEPDVVGENIFIEPEMKNHGPATGFAAVQLAKRGYGDEPFILVQADVLREPGEKFLEMIEQLEDLAKKSGNYITSGFQPESVVRGVDYLVKGELVSGSGGINVYKVADYISRTEEEKIKQYLGTDKLLLHANHTTMTPNNLLKMYGKYKPEWYGPLMAITKGGDVAIEYAKMPKAGVEEVTEQAYRDGEALVVELPFKWVDFGTWESVANYLGTDANGNFIRTEKKTVVIGLNDIVVVETGEGLLVCKKDQSGKVGLGDRVETFL